MLSAKIRWLVEQSSAFPVDIPKDQTPGYPGISEPSASSGQSGNSGSNNNGGDIDPIVDFETRRRAVGSKLRDLYVNKPPRTRIIMTHPDYSEKISA
jgi:hypothetical protein